MPAGALVRDPDDMNDEQRIQAVGRLFATAVVRLRARPTTSLKSPKSATSPLELSPQTRLSVTTVNGSESPQ